MKNRIPHSLFSVALLVVLLSFISACGGGSSTSGGDGGGSGSSSTTVSGRVSLSSTAGGKPDIAAKVLSSVGIGQATALPGAIIKLYDADRPDWLYPVAEELADDQGDYHLTNRKYGLSNGGAYSNGTPIPAGRYTLIAEKNDNSVIPNKFYVKVQSIVKYFSGAVTNDIEVIDAYSTAPPRVVSMFGLEPNADGMFGNSSFELPVNAAIQITFDMPMSRLTYSAISIIGSGGPLTNGKWKMSPDLLAATYYPFQTLTTDAVYTVTINNMYAYSVYNKQLPASVTGTFKAKNTDILPPNVQLIVPVVLSNVPVTSPIRIASSEVLDLNTFTITANPSIGTKPLVLYAGKRADAGYPFVYEIQPSAALDLNRVYSMTVSGAKDVAGNEMTPLTFNFQTEASASMPSCIATNPTNSASSIPRGTSVSATFSAMLDCLTVNETTFTLSSGATVSGTVTCSGATAVFTPLAPLSYGTSYTALTSGFKDIAGTAVTSYAWNFTTVAAPDTTPPTVLTTNPVGGASGIASNTSIVANFSEAINPSTVNATTFQISPARAGSLNTAGNVVTFTTSTNLSYSTTYTVTITGGASGVRDMAGNPLASNYVWSFTTGAAPDTTPPTVSTTSPLNNATEVNVAANIRATFSEALLNSSVNTSTFTLTETADPTVSIPGTVTGSGSTATFDPTSNLAYNTSYTATLTTGIRDAAGNRMASSYSWRFTTATPPTGLWDTSTWDNAYWGP